MEQAQFRKDRRTMDLIERLKYIADSPPREHGGFHEQTIQTAKDAIIHLENARTIIERGVEIMTPRQVGQWEGVRSWLEQT